MIDYALNRSLSLAGAVAKRSSEVEAREARDLGLALEHSVQDSLQEEEEEDDDLLQAIELSRKESTVAAEAEAMAIEQALAASQAAMQAAAAAEAKAIEQALAASQAAMQATAVADSRHEVELAAALRASAALAPPPYLQLRSTLDIGALDGPPPPSLLGATPAPPLLADERLPAPPVLGGALLQPPQPPPPQPPQPAVPASVGRVRRSSSAVRQLEEAIAITNGYDGATATAAAARDAAREAALVTARERHPSAIPTVGPAASCGFGSTRGATYAVSQPALPRSDSIKRCYEAQHHFVLMQLSRTSLCMDSDDSDSDGDADDDSEITAPSRALSKFV